MIVNAHTVRPVHSQHPPLPWQRMSCTPSRPRATSASSATRLWRWSRATPARSTSLSTSPRTSASLPWCETPTLLAFCQKAPATRSPFTPVTNFHVASPLSRLTHPTLAPTPSPSLAGAWLAQWRSRRTSFAGSQARKRRATTLPAPSPC